MCSGREIVIFVILHLFYIRWRYWLTNVVHVVVLKVWCDLLFVFVMISKRSNFITRLAADKKHILIMRLLYLAEVLNVVILLLTVLVLLLLHFDFCSIAQFLRATA